MHTITVSKGLVDLSDEQVAEYAKDLGEFISLENKLNAFALIDLTLIQIIMPQQGFPYPENVRMLEAHNDPTKPTWHYVERVEANRPIGGGSVQDWVNQNDGRFDALYITVCNEKNYTLQSKKSHLVYPTGRYSGAMLHEIYRGEGTDRLRITAPSEH